MSEVQGAVFAFLRWRPVPLRSFSRVYANVKGRLDTFLGCAERASEGSCVRAINITVMSTVMFIVEALSTPNCINIAKGKKQKAK